MKKGFVARATMFMGVIVCCAGFILNTKEVSANTLTTIPLQEVQDIANVPYPTTMHNG